MTQSTACRYLGCSCTEYIKKESSSKWSKGQCDTCTHSFQFFHKKLAPQSNLPHIQNNILRQSLITSLFLWKNKNIHEWKCNELQDWIKSLRMAKLNEVNILKSVKDKKCSGVDFSHCSNAKDMANLLNITESLGGWLYGQLKQFKPISAEAPERRTNLPQRGARDRRYSDADYIIREPKDSYAAEQQHEQKHETIPKEDEKTQYNELSKKYKALQDKFDKLQQEKKQSENHGIELKNRLDTTNKTDQQTKQELKQQIMQNQKLNDVLKIEQNENRKLQNQCKNMQQLETTQKKNDKMLNEVKQRNEKIMGELDEKKKELKSEQQLKQILNNQHEQTFNVLNDKIIKIDTEKDALNRDNNELIQQNEQLKVMVNENQNKDEIITKLKQEIKQLKFGTINSEQQIQELQQESSKQKQEYDKIIKRLRDEVNINKEWKDDYFCTKEELSNAMTEKQLLNNSMKELNDKMEELQNKFDKYKKQVQQNQHIGVISSPTDITDDESDSKYGNENDDQFTFVPLNNDELCKKLQEDLENYDGDQRRSSNKKHPLKTLNTFHDNETQVIRNWESGLKQNYYKNMLEELLEIFEDKYEYSDIDLERLVHNILFDIVIECYDILHTEQRKIKDKEYVNRIVIDMIYMNINNIYGLLKKKKLKKRMVCVYTFISGIIDDIYKNVLKKHMNYMDEDIKEMLYGFIVQCCEIIWSLLHYDYEVYPQNFKLSKSDAMFDDMKHERENKQQICKNIDYYTFPGVMKDNEYKIRIWVMCDIE